MSGVRTAAAATGAVLLLAVGVAAVVLSGVLVKTSLGWGRDGGI